VGKGCWPDHSLQLAVPPTIPRQVKLPLDPGAVLFTVSFNAMAAVKDVINPLFQIVKDHETILFAHGLLNVLEPGGPQHFNDLDIPDPNEIRNPLGQRGGILNRFDRFPSQLFLPGLRICREEDGPIDLDPIGSALDGLLYIGSRTNASCGNDGEAVSELALDEKAVDHGTASVVR